VTVAAFEVLAARPCGDLLDVDVTVTCSTGTYVRALARDLGVSLGVGGHLTRLRRTRSGHYDLSQARTLDQLAEAAASPGNVASLVMPMASAAEAGFPSWRLTAEQARSLAFGSRLPGAGLPDGPVAAFSPEGSLVALVEQRGDLVKPLAVFTDPPAPGTQTP
jgi:tRNA pseudouridine55 synthase